MKHNILDKLGRAVERGIERVADKLPDVWLKTHIKQRKADQVYKNVQFLHSRRIARRDESIEAARLENTKRQKQIEKQDIKLEKDRIKLEELRLKHGRK